MGYAVEVRGNRTVKFSEKGKGNVQERERETNYLEAQIEPRPIADSAHAQRQRFGGWPARKY